MEGKLINTVEKTVAEELKRANEKFPPFNSPHEGYAVLLEEYEEAKYELKAVKTKIKELWEDVRYNNFVDNNVDPFAIDNLEGISCCAVQLACEAIQVAAMAEKILQLVDTQNKKE